MVRRPLGRAGFAVSPIGLGTTKIGRNTDVKYPEGFALPSDSEVSALLEMARTLGVNLIDTAPAYGSSEARLGPLLKDRRDAFLLSTKAGEHYADGRSTYDFTARAIVASAEQSLRHLRTDHLDLLLLHSDGRDLDILTQTDALEGLARLKRSGKIRAAGISAKTHEGIVEACRTLDVVMAPFSQKESSLADALALAHEGGLGVLAIKGLLSGHLEARSAIAYVLEQPFIDALIIGTLKSEHLRTAVEIARWHRGAV